MILLRKLIMCSYLKIDHENLRLHSLICASVGIGLPLFSLHFECESEILKGCESPPLLFGTMCSLVRLSG
jgi:hypothetical protein